MCLLVPGLNDHAVLFKPFYSWIVRRWQRKGVDCQLVTMNWSDDQTYEDKLALILKKIDALPGKVVLVGVSAGASIVVPAFAKRRHKVSGIITISGLLSLAPGDEAKVEFFDRAWYGAAKASEGVLKKVSAADLQRIVTFSPWRDSVIAPERAQIAGAVNRRVPSMGHVFSIGVTLILYANIVIAEVRRLARAGE